MRLPALLPITASILLASCAATTTFVREPSGAGETFVVGRVLLDCQLTKTGSVPIGKYRYNVRLEFEDEKTGKKLQARAVDPQGFFYLLNPPSDRIRLVRLSYEQYYAQPEIHKKSGDGKNTPGKKSEKASTSMRPFRERTFEVRKNIVNNLGHLVWTADLSGGTHRITFNQEYEETRKAFADRYPASLWNGREWFDVAGR